MPKIAEASGWASSGPIDAFERGAERDEAGDMLDMAGQQQMIDHVEDEQRLHAVIREALAASVKAR